MLRAVSMRRVAATRACQFSWLLLGLTLVVEGRMLPTAGPNLIGPCKYTWQLPGTDCWSPIGQSPPCVHLHSEGCAGSPLTGASKPTKGADQVEAVTTELEHPDSKAVPGRLPPSHCQNPSVLVAERDFSHDVWTEVQEDRPDLQIHCECCHDWPPPVDHHVNQDETMTETATMEPEDPDCKPVPGQQPPIRCQNPSMKASMMTAKVIKACQYTWLSPGTDCWPPIGQSCEHLNGEGCGDPPPTGD